MSKTKKQSNPRYLLALSLHIKERDGSTYSGETGEVVARAVAIDTQTRKRCDTDRGDWEGMAFIYADDYQHLREYQEFRFQTWFYSTTGKYYGSGPQFEAGSYCGLDDAVRYARVLTTIDKALTKLVDRRGYPADLADYLGRVAEVIGADCFCVERSAEQRDHTGYRWRCLDLGSGITHVRHAINDIVAKHQTQEVSASS